MGGTSEGNDQACEKVMVKIILERRGLKLEDKKEFFGIVELFGHNRIAGLISDYVLGGASFVRVDVPEVEGSAAITKMYGDKAIYCITPVSEEVVRLFVKRYQPAPLNVYIPEIKQVSSESPDEIFAPGYEEDFGLDDEDDSDE